MRESGKSKRLFKFSAGLIGVVILSMIINYFLTYGGEYIVTIFTKPEAGTNTLGVFDNVQVIKVEEGNKFYILMKNAPIEINRINRNDIKIELTKKQFDDLIVPNKLIYGLPLYLRFSYKGKRGANPKYTFISFTEYNPAAR